MPSSSSKKRRNVSTTTSSYGARRLPEPPPSIFPSNLDDLLRFLAVLSLAALVAFACNLAFVRRRHPVPPPPPFCDTAANDEFYDCEPCPEYGECSGGELMECAFGYKKIGRACVEDGLINRTAKKFADGAERHVCESRAKFLCQGTGTVWFQESDIFKLLEECKTKENFILDDATFLLIKEVALRNVEGSLESRVVLDGEKEFMCPDHMVEVYMPFLCSVKHWIYEHILLLFSISAVLSGGALFYWKIRKAKWLDARAEQLYQQICETLEENAMALEMSEPSNAKIQPWVVYSWLRDHLLLPRERKDKVLWKKVEELVQQDSRIDQYPKLIKGESKVVLEWQVKGSLSTKMRKRGKESTSLMATSDTHTRNSGAQDEHRPQPLPNA